jgi:hypothetical protein
MDLIIYQWETQGSSNGLAASRHAETLSRGVNGIGGRLETEAPCSDPHERYPTDANFFRQ